MRHRDLVRLEKVGVLKADSIAVSVVLTAFGAITRRWGLSLQECAVLLATSPRIVKRWQNEGYAMPLAQRQVTSISYLLTIYVGIHEFSLDTEDAPLLWIRMPNSDFRGASPIEWMLSGDLVDIEYARNLFICARLDL
jgi:hypothetical protein